jgi:hypothetical protein
MRHVALSLLMVTGVTTEALAQKPVLLQLRPRISDTIWMRLDQRTELARKGAEGKTPAAFTTTTVTYSRAIIESGVAAATTVVAITDSMFVSSADQSGKGPAPMAQKQIQGQRVRLHIAPDGSLSMGGDNSAAPKTMSRAASLIPATFPLTPVAVGDKWMREAPLPSGTSQLGASVVGWVQATFRLDSLTRGGDLAWISVHGKLTPDPSGSKVDGVATVDDGAVDGYMVLDRVRGWLTESNVNIIAHSSLRQPFGAPGQTMSFEIRLIQALRTLK